MSLSVYYSRGHWYLAHYQSPRAASPATANIRASETRGSVSVDKDKWLRRRGDLTKAGAAATPSEWCICVAVRACVQSSQF